MAYYEKHNPAQLADALLDEVRTVRMGWDGIDTSDVMACDVME